MIVPDHQVVKIDDFKGGVMELRLLARNLREIQRMVVGQLVATVTPDEQSRA